MMVQVELKNSNKRYFSYIQELTQNDLAPAPLEEGDKKLNATDNKDKKCLKEIKIAPQKSQKL